VVGLTGLAALVRFLSLATQSYWYDEAVTVGLVRESFGANARRRARARVDTARVLRHRLGPDPGVWGRRSRLAVPVGPCGHGAVPVAYLATRVLVGRRAAVAVAAMTALSPALL